MPKFIKQVSGVFTEEATIVTSGGAGSTGKVPELDANGKLDNSFMPTGIGAATTTLNASENLAAGDFVNVFDNAGTANVRKADASNGRVAHGFVIAAVTSGNAATVYYGDINNQCSSLTPGAEQYLSGATAGKPTGTAPSTTGHRVQRLGVAVNATTMLVEIQPPITLA